VSDVDTTALEGLIELQRDLRANGVTLHLSEIKGPLSDKLAGALNEFHVHLSNHAAFEQLAKARLG
jgi:SulP family sulfate permease